MEKWKIYRSSSKIKLDIIKKNLEDTYDRKANFTYGNPSYYAND